MNKRKAIISVVILFSLIIVGLFFGAQFDKYRNKETIKGLALNNVPADRKYVRLSLFNTLPDKISLQIPEDWEGSYRVKDNGNLANIFFIDGPEEWELLSFKQFSQFEWENNLDKNWQKIMEDNGLIIVYKLSTGEGVNLEQMNKFNQMRRDIELMIQSIKIR
ncbi:hypothetical protein KAR28_02495 [Candidatus Parcubacteria bacterium]|nr:hypothetical protein [Candidatus Parcubacteria bacterium]